MRNSGSSCSESVGPPLWLLAELTYRCPLQCPYCSNPLEFAREGAELSTAEWIEVFRQARELGAAQLGFSGGEPLLRQDLAELIEAGRGLGFYTNLITSGIGLDEARLARFAEAGLDHVQISFQAADEEVNNLLAGSRKAFAQKLAMARAVKAHGYPMVLNFVTHRHNIDNIERIIQLCIELEADYVELATCQFYGWAALNRAGLLPTRAQLERAERITAEYRQRLAAEGNPCKLIFVTPTTTRNGRRPAWAAGPAYSSTSPPTAPRCRVTARGNCRCSFPTCASTACATSGTNRSASTVTAATPGCPNPAVPARRRRGTTAAAAARRSSSPAMPTPPTRSAPSRHGTT